MLRKLSALVVGLLSPVIITVPATASAHAMPMPKTQTVIAGVVKYKGRPVRHAKVTVTCNGNSRTAYTGPFGGYSVTFRPASQCRVGSTLTVTAVKGSESGVGNGKVRGASCRFDVALVNVAVALPEMGTLTGSAAALTAGGAFTVIRRRNLAKE